MNEIEKILDQNEKIFWQGKPKFLPYLFSSTIFTTIFGLIWMTFMLPFIFGAFFAVQSGELLGFGIFLLPHFWIGIFLVFGIPLYTIFAHSRIAFTITDKRVIFQSGLIGRDFKIVDFDKITNAEVNVNLFDKLFGGNTGTISISSAGTFVEGKHGPVNRPYSLQNIENPYEVFKFLKTVSHDVKTDIEYPNQLRPSTNPGYTTSYDPIQRNK